LDFYHRYVLLFFFSSRRRHTRSKRDWSSDVCSSDLGELDHHEAEILREIWQQKLRDENVRHVILNLEEMIFMDSSGIGVLLGRYKEISQAGGELVICKVNPSLKKIFDMSGLFKI